MQLSDNKKFLIYLSKYLGVALIAGSVVHIGTLENNTIRYLALMVAGLVLMMVGTIAEAKQNGEKINRDYLLLITGLSFATGFVSGGIQHYLDNPSYAGILLGIGLFVTYITFFIKEHAQLRYKNSLIVGGISLLIILLSVYVFDTVFLGEGHYH